MKGNQELIDRITECLNDPNRFGWYVLLLDTVSHLREQLEQKEGEWVPAETPLQYETRCADGTRFLNVAPMPTPMTHWRTSHLTVPLVQEKGPWKAGKDRHDWRTFVESDDFTHDVRLYVDGDFGDDALRTAYTEEIARRLNACAEQQSVPMDWPTDAMVVRGAEYLHDAGIRFGEDDDDGEQQQDLAEGVFRAMIDAR